MDSWHRRLCNVWDVPHQRCPSVRVVELAGRLALEPLFPRPAASHGREIKMMNRLSGWQRLGLVISICWAITSFLGLRIHQYNQGLEQGRAMVGLCTTAGRSFNECWDESSEFRHIAIAPDWPPIFLIALGPIPVFWLLGWAIIKTTRWVRAGFAARAAQSFGRWLARRLSTKVSGKALMRGMIGFHTFQLCESG